MERTFSTPEPVRLHVELQAGSVRINATQTDESQVELHGRNEAGNQLVEEAQVEQRGNDIIVVLPKAKGGLFRGKAEVDAHITVPEDSSAKVLTNSADVIGAGRLGSVDTRTGSGDIEFDHTGTAELKTGSGDVKIDTIDGDAEIKTGSGDVVLGTVNGGGRATLGSGDFVAHAVAGRLTARTGSGDFVIGEPGEELTVTTGSGDLLVKRVNGGVLRFKAGSGDISLGIVDGTAVYLDVMTGSGTVRSELDGSEQPTDGRTAELHAMTGSGDIKLSRV
jgi:DUF4097 and DUF4098 domain-containing protein YvlB